MEQTTLQARRAYQRAWYHKNHNKRRKQWKRSYERHKKARRSYGRNYGKMYYKKNAAKLRKKKAHYRKSADGWIREAARRFRYATKRHAEKQSHPTPRLSSIDDLVAVIKAATHCPYCNRELTPGVSGNMGFDHKEPISRGGDGTVNNFAPCCRSCNREKGNMTVEEFTSLLALIKSWADNGKGILARLKAAGLVFNRA